MKKNLILLLLFFISWFLLSYFVFNYEKEEDFSVVNDKIIQEREIKMIEKSLDNASNPQVKERLNSVLEKTKDRLKTLEKIEKIEDEQSSDVKIWSSISVLYWFINYDCNSFELEKFVKMCFGKKLEDTYLFRKWIDFKDIPCEERFNIIKFPWFEEKAKKYLDICLSEKSIK